MFATRIADRKVFKNGRTYMEFRKTGKTDASCKVTESDGKVKILSVWWRWPSLKDCVRAQEYSPGDHFGRDVNYQGIPLDVRRSLKEAVLSNTY